jgi:hypothetical protein
MEYVRVKYRSIIEYIHHSFIDSYLSIGMEGHHCPEPGCGDIKLHVAFCCVRIRTADGRWRFCGNRLGVETPDGCSKHHYGECSENRFIQMAKKNLPYELPRSFPHEQPGWKVILSKLGNLHESDRQSDGFLSNRQDVARR